MLPIINSFLLRHNFPTALDISSITSSILYDMNLGLGFVFSNEKSGQDMFRTWLLPPKNPPRCEKVIVIDAGGTNFRSCLVSFDESGNASVSDFRKTSMPGVEKELSKKEFFSKIADNIEYLKNKSEKIGFCFSYAMQITKDGDGIPNAFSKEIKAPEVLGVPVGKTLCEELSARGWNKIKKITLLNDTVSALLSGAGAFGGRQFSSYIGFILGTGMNAAYIQPETGAVENQIIVCEAGKCDKIPLSDFDVTLDKKTAVPGQYKLEKGCSGAYLGKIGLEMLLSAAEESIFSSSANEKIKSLTDLTLIEMDSFLQNPFSESLVSELCENDDDRQKIYELFERAVDRTARYAASILSANAIQSGAGKNPLRPICIVANGTTFYKTHKLKQKIESYLYDFLTEKNSIYFEIVQVENDITIGTAVAGLI